MLYALMLMGGLGLCASAGLAIASRIFRVEQDPRIDEVLDSLPGANCGGCGYAGCAALAEAIVAGKAEAGSCVAGGDDVAKAVAAVMGVDVSFNEPRLARGYCNDSSRADDKFDYDGAPDCRAAALVHGGPVSCELGCLGYGSCAKACQFDAIEMVDGKPVFYSENCVGCGACVEVCPRNIISLRKMSEHLIHLNLQTECLAPCTQLCPAQINIKGYIEAAGEGRYEEAVRIIKDRNPLPLVCGRVCPAPCENACRRNAIGDDPVGHNYIKRFVADFERKRDKRIDLPQLPDSGKRVAIVGGGPAGLSAAYFLRRLGHSPKIYENMPALGGFLRYGIPEYRLPKKILDWEIQGILDMGVEAEVERRLGRDFTLDDLEEAGFDAVFVATGAWNNASLRCEGEDLPGVLSGTEFLTNVALGDPPDVGKTVVIVGGGNTAIDAARTSLRLGAEKVTLMYRRTRAEMPANEVEIEASIHEKIELKFLAAPTKLVPSDDGRVAQIEYITMKLGEPDKSGRRRPVPIEGSEKTFDVDTVIAAIGQKVDGDIYTESWQEKGVVQDRWGSLEADPVTMQTGAEWIFTGGDYRTGPGLVVEAIGDGRKAARSIHLYLSGEPVEAPALAQRGLLEVSKGVVVSGVRRSERITMPELPVADRIDNMDEVDQTVDEVQILVEAGRCLNCGTVCFNRKKQGEAA